MADLVRRKTEIECVINDFAQASEGGEERRQAMADELEELEEKITTASDRLDVLIADLEESLTDERDAKEK